MKLYRYQPINKLTISNLSKGKNWVANPLDFNDPFEFRITDLYFEKEFKNQPDESRLKAREQYKEFIDGFGVVCYSKKNLSTLMFSHYSDSHKGMCLEFDVPDFYEIAIKEVKYMDNIDEFVFSTDRSIWRDEIIKICTTKSKVWEYENEQRQLFTENLFHAEYPGKLTGITFGCKATKDDIELVLSVLNSEVKNIRISKAFIQKNSFLLGLLTIGINKEGKIQIPNHIDGLLEA